MGERTVGGRYELLTRLGRGGMGEVWAAHDRVIGRGVAVKLLRHEATTPGAVELFFREARTAGSLQHPGIVTVFDLGRDPADGTLYLVMAKLEGRDLRTVSASEGTPAVRDAVAWAAQIADALAAAHTAGIVHRDLKPANLMLGPDGRVTVLDFGIARFVEATGESSQVVGTLAYMPPERFEHAPGDARGDLYSLGCVLNELLTGEPPFKAAGAVSMMAAHLNTAPERPSSVRGGITAELDDLVLQLLAKDPAERPESASEVADRLRGLTGLDSTGDGSTGDGSAPPGNVRPAGHTRPASHDQQPSADTAAVAATRGTSSAAPPLGLVRTAPPPVWSRRRVLRIGAGAAVGAVGMFAAFVAWPADDVDAKPYVWRTKVGGYTTEVLLGDDVLYVPSADLLALSPATGKEIWRHTDGSIAKPPVVVEDTVVAIAGAGVIGLHRATGVKKWEQPSDSPYVLLAGGDTFVAAVTMDGRIDCRDASDGRLRWTQPSPRAPLPGVLAAASPGTVWIVTSDKAAEFDAASGARRRELVLPTPVGTLSGLLVRSFGSTDTRGTLVISGDLSFTAWAPDGSTWTSHIGAQAATRPAEGSGLVVIGGRDGRLYGFHGETPRWIVPLGSRPVRTPSAWTGLVHATSADTAALIAVAPDDGGVVWWLELPDVARGAPVAGVDLVYVVCDDNHLYALDHRTGQARP